MSRKHYIVITLMAASLFVIGMATGFLISLVDQDKMPTVKNQSYVEIETSYGSILRLSKKVVDELGRLNSELREAEEVSEGMWRMMFTHKGGPLRVCWHPDILDLAVMLKEGDGHVDYSQFFLFDE